MNNKILIADDSSFMRLMLKDELLKAGYKNISEAKSGPLAIKAYKLDAPGAVILDVALPELDGIETLKKIMAFDSKANVIMCSSLGQEEIVTACFEAGAKDFVMKPFKPGRLLGILAELLPPEGASDEAAALS